MEFEVPCVLWLVNESMQIGFDRCFHCTFHAMEFNIKEEERRNVKCGLCFEGRAMMIECFFFLSSCTLSRECRVAGFFDNEAQQKSFELVEKQVEELNCSLEVFYPSDPKPELRRFGEWRYRSLVIGTSRMGSLGQELNEVRDFLDEGGNAILFGGRKGNEVQNAILTHIGIAPIGGGDVVNSRGEKRIRMKGIVGPESIVGTGRKEIVYEGGFTTIDRPNQFRIPLVVGGYEHTSQNDERYVGEKRYGKSIVVIGGFQSRVGGRIVLICSNKFMHKDLVDESEGENGILMKELMKWGFHLKSSLNLVESSHVSTESGVTPVQYHEKENITVRARIEEGGVGYEGDDVQVEVFMLGVFVRRHMKKMGGGLYEETLMLPDRAGNFKVTVFTNKDGWKNVREEMAIAIRPLSIRERPRYLRESKPYQQGLLVMLIGTFILMVHFLFHKSK